MTLSHEGVLQSCAIYADSASRSEEESEYPTACFEDSSPLVLKYMGVNIRSGDNLDNGQAGLTQQLGREFHSVRERDTKKGRDVAFLMMHKRLKSLTRQGNRTRFRKEENSLFLGSSDESRSRTSAPLLVHLLNRLPAVAKGETSDFAARFQLIFCSKAFSLLGV